MNHQGTKHTKEMADGLEKVDPVARQVVDAAFQVHKNLGPGLLENIYERCLAFELAEKGLKFERQKEFPIEYKGNRLDDAGRVDLLVEDCLIVEIKAVESIVPVHKAQILSYLKMMDKKVGLLINFNTALFKDGIQRFAL